MKKVIGIDYGSRKVGVAISDITQRFAFAKDIYPNDGTLLDTLTELAEKEGAECFVIGESDNPAGGDNAIMRRIAFFAEALEVRTKIPVHKVREAYSTAEARRALETKVKTRKDVNTQVDSAAAAIILQTYLDTKQVQGA